jgi:glucose/arabinose dehydrogenase
VIRITHRVLRRLATIATLVVAMSAGAAVHAQTSLHLPTGFHASIYAGGFNAPTALAIGPDKRLYVAQEDGTIIATGRGTRSTIASGLALPLGLAWHSGTLYVSSTGKVTTLTPSSGYHTFTRRTIISGLPYGKHQNDGMAFRAGWMYLGVGSTCNACVESDPRSATIMRFHDNGTHAQVYAKGLRNPYGLAFRPGTANLYATDNGRDDYDDQVPDELNLIVHNGMYGWPNCWGNRQGITAGCSATRAPVALFEAHSSADGIAFYTGKTFPKRYRGDAFVAEWGDSVNLLGTGQRVKRVHFANGHATVTDFATGFTHPLAIVVARDGSLLVADWGAGVVWRIQSNGH